MVCQGGGSFPVLSTGAPFPTPMPDPFPVHTIQCIQFQMGDLNPYGPVDSTLAPPTFWQQSLDWGNQTVRKISVQIYENYKEVSSSTLAPEDTMATAAADPVDSTVEMTIPYIGEFHLPVSCYLLVIRFVRSVTNIPYLGLVRQQTSRIESLLLGHCWSLWIDSSPTSLLFGHEHLELQDPFFKSTSN